MEPSKLSLKAIGSSLHPNWVWERVHHVDAASNPRYAAIRPEWDQPMERIRLLDFLQKHRPNQPSIGAGERHGAVAAQHRMQATGGIGAIFESGAC